MPGVKGKTNNPHGRPAAPEIQELREALAKVKAKKGKAFLEHFVERAYENDACAVALAKKIVADKVHVDDPGLADAVRTFLVRADSNQKSNSEKKENQQ